MKDLRALLIDCRIELRKLSRDFQKTELCDRLDLAIQAASQPDAPPAAPAETAGPSALPPEKAQTVSQVALAWQAAARDLKFSDPAIYQRLGDKVMRLLGAKTLSDPATELHELGEEVEALKARLDAAAKASQALEVERDALLGALAKAVPQLKDGGDRLAVALARIAWLGQRAATPASGAAPARKVPEPDSTIPSPELLRAAAAGAQALTKEQREWCVGEAMVLTGFQYTPVELLAEGDAKLARTILEAKKPG